MEFGSSPLESAEVHGHVSIVEYLNKFIGQ